MLRAQACADSSHLTNEVEDKDDVNSADGKDGSDVAQFRSSPGVGEEGLGQERLELSQQLGTPSQRGRLRQHQVKRVGL